MINGATKSNDDRSRNRTYLAFAVNLDNRDETLEKFGKFLENNFAYFCYLTGSPEEAEELRQEIALTFLMKSEKSLEWLRGIDNPSAYVFKSARYKFYTLRKKKSPAASLDDVKEVSETDHRSDNRGSAFNIVKNMEREEFYKHVEDASRGLPKYEAAIFDLYLKDNLAPAIIANEFLDKSKEYGRLLEELLPELVKMSAPEREELIKETVPVICNAVKQKMIKRLRKSLKV